MSYTQKDISRKITLLADETDGAVYLIKGRDMSLIFDTGWDSRPLKPLAESLIKTPYKVVFSHGHVDHVGRSGEFDAVYMDKNDMGIYRSNPVRTMPHLTFISEDKILPVENIIDLSRTHTGQHTAGGQTGKGCVYRRRNRFRLRCMAAMYRCAESQPVP